MLLLVVLALVVVLVSVGVGVVRGLVALVVACEGHAGDRLDAGDGCRGAGEAVGVERAGHAKGRRGERDAAHHGIVEIDPAHALEQVIAQAVVLVAGVTVVIGAARVVIILGLNELDRHRALGTDGLARLPVVVTQLYHVAQHEAYAHRQLAALGQHVHPFKVLLHQPFALVRIKGVAAGTHYLTETLNVLRT